ncbi:MULTISPECIES: YybH family protein [unclassified Mycobacterium]|uniref:YybH family protein n=1 Tax=unclassified Mycobacterium TaxID=2642494 RepID=UPI0029C66A2D|nr:MULTISPECIES: nuclear transport factor 2 family protein [unclassified Mycobacterium]
MTYQQISITGREELGDRSQPIQALSEFYRAFNARDLELAARSWDNGDDSVMDNPLGGISRGWPAIEAVYAKLFNGPNRVQVEFWDYSIVETADCFIAIGRERGSLTMHDGTTLELRIRTSRVFRRASDNEWRQVHHHGSIDEPDLLRAYQSAVIG